MKLLFIPTIFSTLLLAASTVNSAPCTSDNCATNQESCNGIRQYSGLETKNLGKRVFQKKTKGWFKTEWNEVMAKGVNKSSIAENTATQENQYAQSDDRKVQMGLIEIVATGSAVGLFVAYLTGLLSGIKLIIVFDNRYLKTARTKSFCKHGGKGRDRR